MLRTKAIATSALGAALLLGHVTAQAAEEVGQAYLKGMGSYIIADDDRNVDDELAGGLVGFGYALNDNWNIEFDFQGLNLDGKGSFLDGGEGGSTTPYPDQKQRALNLNLLNLYNRGGSFSPFILLGTGIVNTDVRGSSDSDDLQIQAGVGLLSHIWADRLFLRTEALYRWQDASGGSLSDILFNAGLSVAIGDKAPPPVAAAAPVAPPPPPPPLDSDGDGVPDNIDQCPGTPAGAVVDARGCELDSDGDGVVDRLDECPGTPAGAKVNERGCEESLILRGVTFETSSAALNAQDKMILDSVAGILKQRPNFTRIEVRGHTDSTGPLAYNQALSERRAASVRDYLISQGIDAKKLSSRGFGPSQPIASNDTVEGRAENRRVTLEFSEAAN